MYPVEGRKVFFAWLRKMRRALFPSLAVIPGVTSELAQQAVVRRVVRTYARGNLNLKLGRYVTADQIEARKRQISKHSF